MTERKNNVAEIRKQLGLSQTEFADLINITRSHLSNIENDKVKPGGEVITKICYITGKQPYEIFFNLLGNYSAQQL